MSDSKILTKEQEQKLYKYLNEQVDFILNNEKYRPDPLKIKDIQEDIEWLYTASGHQPPAQIIIVNDPFVTTNTKEDSYKIVFANNPDSILNNLYEKLLAPLWARTNSELRPDTSLYEPYQNIIRDRLDFIVDRIWSVVMTEDRIWNAVMTDKSDDKVSLIGSSPYFGYLYDFPWLNLYNFYMEIGSISPIKELQRYFNFFRKGVWSASFLKDVCVIVQYPKKIHIDERKRLHSTEGEAIEWRTTVGKKSSPKYHYIHGVRFEQNLWESVVSNAISMEGIMSMTNMEQRMAILSIIDPQKLIKELDAKLISSYTPRPKKDSIKYILDKEKNQEILHPIELYEIDGTKFSLQFNVYILFYTDPSTGREYFSFVPPDKALDAATAMAFKFGLTKEEYIHNLIVET